MGAIAPMDFEKCPVAPIDFEKGLVAPSEFCWKQGFKGNLHPAALHPSFKILKGESGILYPSIEIPNETPVQANCF